ncbi:MULTISPECIES: DsbC family protein [unclassified Acinetobacter]|uniref:DsbC family protein n=1 Tax=unclassified Acinetobacter TaxID=196816 RepID=UPI00293529AE|nr:MULTISPECIES: DsbC family protein [unclassified Acinetobacter]WOE30839.1 DsbC family protein [Acinetobacter sp. SAAs470]WOE39034.1 DsbC family protein [Acinetobacter sp. SAAs474]
MKKTILWMAALASTLSHANLETASSNLSKNYPNIKVEQIAATEMKGIYSGTLSGQIVYFNDDAQHLIAGTMVRLKDQRNLSKDLMVKQNTIDWKKLNLNDAIKIVKGNGKRQIAVFSDPNCPYCKKLETELDQLNNVTIYMFILPFKPQSVAPSKQVYCSQNPAQAWTDLINSGIQPTVQKTCNNPIERNLAIAKSLGITGTPTIIFSNGLKVVGAFPVEQMEEIFKDFGL